MSARSSHRPAHIGHPRPADRMTKVRLGALRFAVYGALLLAGEIVFYNVVRLGRHVPVLGQALFGFDWAVDARLSLTEVWSTPAIALYGQASLWMFFVYGGIVFFGLEPAQRLVRPWPWWVRGLVYMTIILSLECALGWILRALTGFDIWLYHDRLTVLRYTTFAIAPAWFALGMISEQFVRLVDEFTAAREILAQAETTAEPLPRFAHSNAIRVKRPRARPDALHINPPAFFLEPESSTVTEFKD